MQVIPGLGRTVVERTIRKDTGSEGPRHDPYHFDRWTVDVNGQRVVLTEGIVVRLKVIHGKAAWPKWKSRTVEQLQESHDPDSVKRIYARFKELTGLDRDSLERIHNRLHPYFDDPMGNPASYI